MLVGNSKIHRRIAQLADTLAESLIDVDMPQETGCSKANFFVTSDPSGDAAEPSSSIDQGFETPDN